MKRLNVGVIGLGRLGKVYARDLARTIAETRVVAVADTAAGVAESIAREHDVARWFTDPLELIRDREVEAVVIVTPTDTHSSLTVAALESGKPTFCEKPPAITLPQTFAMRDAAERTRVPLHMGFMRRFDSGYAAAKKKLESGAIGNAVVFKSSSRDPYPPSVEYANPKSSGGLILDMGIHDLDLARWYMGDVESVHPIGGTLAYPQLGAVGDIDNAIVTLRFTTGRLGVVDLSRNGIYGFDIRTELLGTRGTLQIGYLRETPVNVMTEQGVTHDTVPYFMERFRDAYTTQLQNFAQNVQQERPAPITIEDGMEALRIGVAATRAHETGRSVVVSAIKA
jgi:inositol 2-dehydrogenase